MPPRHALHFEREPEPELPVGGAIAAVRVARCVPRQIWNAFGGHPELSVRPDCSDRRAGVTPFGGVSDFDALSPFVIGALPARSDALGVARIAADASEIDATSGGKRDEIGCVQLTLTSFKCHRPRCFHQPCTKIVMPARRTASRFFCCSASAGWVILSMRLWML